jgi:thioredoxin-related protein
MKFRFFILLLALVVTSCSGRKEENGDLVWLTVEDASRLASEGTDKKFLLDVYTDWCGWCKVMDKKTFTDPALVTYLSQNFHLVKFNAEQKEPIVYKGKTYTWQDMGRNGVNALAIELLQGQLGYPSLIYFDQQLNVLRVSPGYKEPAQLLSDLKSL